jgi:uncharacterized membrane protein
MRKAMFVCLVGFVLLVLPYLGIPTDFREYILVGAGVLLVLFGYMLMRDEILRRSDYGNGERGSDSFIETTEPLFKDQSY